MGDVGRATKRHDRRRPDPRPTPPVPLFVGCSFPTLCLRFKA